MNVEEFQKCLEGMQTRTVEVLKAKAVEYASEGDRLHNFKSASVIEHETPVQALSGMMAKHTISVYDMIAAGKDYPIELWEEKIGDHINYLFLLYALIKEGSK